MQMCVSISLVYKSHTLVEFGFELMNARVRIVSSQGAKSSRDDCARHSIGHFRSLHGALVHSVVYEYLAVDGGGNVSE